VTYVHLHSHPAGDEPSHATVAFADGTTISIDEDDYNLLVLSLSRLQPQKMMGVVTAIREGHVTTHNQHADERRLP
jgi:hypothetical protein